MLQQLNNNNSLQQRQCYLWYRVHVKLSPQCQGINQCLRTEVKWGEVAQLCLILCDPMDCSLTGSSVHGIFQTRILEWVAISFSRGSSRPRDRTRVSCIVGSCFTVWATREVVTKWILLVRYESSIKWIINKFNMSHTFKSLLVDYVIIYVYETNLCFISSILQFSFLLFHTSPSVFIKIFVKF